MMMMIYPSEPGLLSLVKIVNVSVFVKKLPRVLATSIGLHVPLQALGVWTLGWIVGKIL